MEAADREAMRLRRMVQLRVRPGGHEKLFTPQSLLD
jgi:hypothetical protein